ncbi:MAG TPA: hypothetical protein VG838_07045 [Opitutaceae bacterium]|nr:hypothetical protein [Lacunisphaera sp.]HWA09187.1 hypothetical protein [Opitutaceae bacterium]
MILSEPVIGRKRTGSFRRIHGLLLGILCAVLLVGTIAQPFLPRLLETSVVWLRLVLVPVLIWAVMLDLTERFCVLLISVLWLGLETLHDSPLVKTDYIALLSMLTCLPYFTAGLKLRLADGLAPMWHAILWSAFVVNIVTLVLYGLGLSSHPIVAEVLATVRREGEDPNFRFALGNAIEVPAALSIATVASLAALGRPTSYIPVALMLNFAAAIVSQSRIVLLIAAYPVFGLWRHFSRPGKIVAITLVTVAVCWQSYYITDTWASIRERYSGQDAGSAISRIERVRLVYQHMDIGCLTFGHGVYSSVRLMEANGFGYLSVESALLQLFYEKGLLSILIFLGYLGYALRARGCRLVYSLPLALVLLQVLMLLPVNSYMPLSFFCIGVLCAGRRKERDGWHGHPAIKP